MPAPLLDERGQSAEWITEVILPGFTTMGTAHAAVRCRVEIVTPDEMVVDFIIRGEGGRSIHSESVRLTGADLGIKDYRRR